jgi:hypothetical protein
LDQLKRQVTNGLIRKKPVDELQAIMDDADMSSEDPILQGAAAELAAILDAHSLGAAMRTVLEDSLVEWQAQNPETSVSDRSGNTERFTSDVLCGVIDLLMRRLEAVRRVASLSADAAEVEVVRAEKHVLSLYEEARALKAKVATPAGTVRQLYRLLGSR